MKRQLLIATATLASFGLYTQHASAHAVSIGYENAGPGSVTVWLGTYNHGGHHNEGGLQLEGVNGTSFGPVQTAFNLLTATGVGFKPAGLIDGTTNFFVSGTGNAPLVGTPTIYETVVCPACGPVNHWQGATFAGLTAGDYKFTWLPLNTPTAEWTPFSDSMNGIFELTGAVVNPDPTPVPEPTTLSLLGLGLFGVAALRRRKS